MILRLRVGFCSSAGRCPTSERSSVVIEVSERDWMLLACPPADMAPEGGHFLFDIESRKATH
jgi:hypothetical protein